MAVFKNCQIFSTVKAVYSYKGSHFLSKYMCYSRGKPSIYHPQLERASIYLPKLDSTLFYEIHQPLPAAGWLF